MMKKTNKLIYWVLFAIAVIMAFLIWQNQHKNPPTPQSSDQVTVQSITPTQVAQSPVYKAKNFYLLTKLKGFSNKQIKEHEELYRGYVNQRNKITKALETVDRTQPSRTYSPFRGMKVAETYAINGQILHELYFENLGGEGTKVGKQMLELINKNFGSFEKFKKDFMDCGQVSRGWVVTAYSLDDNRLHNFVLEEHNQNVPVLMLPLLVLDVYEHAYMIDFGIKRIPYLDVFWQNIDWNAIERRIIKWVNKFRDETTN